MRWILWLGLPVWVALAFVAASLVAEPLGGAVALIGLPLLWLWLLATPIVLVLAVVRWLFRPRVLESTSEDRAEPVGLSLR